MIKRYGFRSFFSELMESIFMYDEIDFSYFLLITDRYLIYAYIHFELSVYFFLENEQNASAIAYYGGKQLLRYILYGQKYPEIPYSGIEDSWGAH